MNDKVFSKVVELQAEVNRKAQKNLIRPVNYYRAIWLEAAELVESLDWKWWKKQTSNYENVKIEVVDIFHFVLSQAIRQHKLDGAQSILKHAYTNYINDMKNEELVQDKDENIILSAEALATIALVENEDYELQFMFIFELWDLTLDYKDELLDEFFKTYFIKNTLNLFRYNNGYLEGTYQKVVNGKEDNEYALEFAKDMTVDDIVNGKLYKKLENTLLF